MESFLLRGHHDDRRVNLVLQQRRCGECSHAGARMAEYAWISLVVRRSRTFRSAIVCGTPKSRTRPAALASTPDNRSLLQFKLKSAFDRLLRFDIHYVSIGRPVTLLIRFFWLAGRDEECLMHHDAYLLNKRHLWTWTPSTLLPFCPCE
jgi:hypothetical protein